MTTHEHTATRDTCLRRGDGYYLTANLNLATGENEIGYAASPWLAYRFTPDEARQFAASIAEPVLHPEKWRTPAPAARRRP